MESGRVKIICSVIGGLVLLGAAIIGVAHHYFLKGEDEAIDEVVPVSLAGEEAG